MGSDAEYNSLVSQRNSAWNRYHVTQNQIATIKRKIERLKSAKKAMGNCHSDFEDIQKTVKKHVEGSYEWQGTNKNTFDYQASLLKGANETYRRNIDSARDAINNEITRLQNELLNQQGILGNILASINSLTTRIENYFNG